MAKRTIPRRKTRKPAKPNIVEIEGHKLTKMMHADFQSAFDARKRQFIASGKPKGSAYELALDDFLAGYRPSKKIKAQLPVLYARLFDAILAVATMTDYPFFVSHGPARKLGCQTLNGLALELQSVSATLAMLAEGVEVEASTKVQDWLARADYIERIGNSRAFAHGNEEVAHG